MKYDIYQKEFNEVPSRSKRASVEITYYKGSTDIFVLAYHHHEESDYYSGNILEILQQFKESFLCTDQAVYPGTQPMIEEVTSWSMNFANENLI